MKEHPVRICDIAEELGLSTATVSNVIHGKTNKVSEETLSELAERYRSQVNTYAEALSRIYQMPVKSRKLYFFRLKRFVDV